MDIPTTEPEEIIEGDTLKWNRQDLSDDYPASDGWTLKYSFRGILGTFDITATADGDYFSVSVPAATTADYTPGDYVWKAYVELAGDKYTIDSGSAKVLPDLIEEATGYDPRSDAETIVAQLTTGFKKLSNQTASKLSIAGREWTRRDLAEMTTAISYWNTKVAQEKTAERVSKGLGTGNKITTRFK